MGVESGQPLDCIVAVIDPTTESQWALEKAVSIAQNGENIKVVAYLCGYSSLECYDESELQKVELQRQNWWLDHIISKFSSAGVNIAKHLEWGQNWEKGVAMTALQYKANLVVKAASRRPQDLGNSDRHLLRDVGGHVLLVKQPPQPTLDRILLALNMNADDVSHQELNDEIIEVGKRILGNQDGAELHAVNACPDVDQLVHAPDLAKHLGIDRSRVHVTLGTPANVIAQVASDINADQVIMGTVKRDGLAGLTVGNTAEKVLKKLEPDVLVVSQTSTNQP